LPEDRRDPSHPEDVGEHERSSDEEHDTQSSPPPTRSPRPIGTFESPTEQTEAAPSADVDADSSLPPHSPPGSSRPIFSEGSTDAGLGSCRALHRWNPPTRPS
jgi:hypothetical protein